MEPNYSLSLAEFNGELPTLLYCEKPEDFAREYGSLYECDSTGEIVVREFGGVVGAYIVTIQDGDGGDFRSEGLLMTQEVALNPDISERLVAMFEERQNG